MNTEVGLQVVWEQGEEEATICLAANSDTSSWLSLRIPFPNSRCFLRSHERLAPGTQAADDHLI